MFKLQRKYFAIKQFILPDLGEKIKEATIVKWHIQEGDEIEEYDDMADVSTDKLFTQLPSPYEGRVHKLFYKTDEKCNVGDVLLEIEVDSESSLK